MTRGEIVSRVCSTVGLQDTDPMDERSLVQHWVYQGTLDLLSRTRCVARCVKLHTKAGVETYTLAHSILTLIDVEDGRAPRLRRDDTGSGFTLIRSDLFQVHPVPSEDSEVQVWAVLRPVKMSDDAHDLGAEAYGAIPDEFQDAVELYALWKAADYSHESDTQRGMMYRILYEGEDGRGGRLNQIRIMVNKRGTARPPWRRKVTTGSGRTPRLAWVD